MTFFQKLLALFWQNPNRHVVKDDLQLLKDERLRAQALEADLEKSSNVSFDVDSDAPDISKFRSAPAGSSWVGRPVSLSRAVSPDHVVTVTSGDFLGPDIQCFHDSTSGMISLRQSENESGAPYALECSVDDFDGSYLSIVHDLPPVAIKGLSTEHVIRVDLNVSSVRDISGYVRFNVKSGPNMEQLVAQYRPGQEHASEFDLAYSKMNEKRVEKAWVEIMFNNPANTSFVIGEMICSRRRRAEF